MSLGLTQLISQPTRVTPSSKTLIDHIYTSNEDNISYVRVNKQTISDHYAIFGNRKLNCAVNRHSHQTITYRSFKHFDENAFINDLRQVPWEILESFNDVSECVQIWNILFLEIVNKHAPLKQHRVRKENHLNGFRRKSLIVLRREISAKLMEIKGVMFSSETRFRQ